MADDELDRALTDDLEAFLAGDEMRLPPGYTEGDEAELTTAALDDGANWTLRRIKKARRELRRIERAADAERARIAEWQKDRAAGPTRLIEQEEAALEAIARRLVEMNPQRKSIDLPNGRLQLRAPGAPSVIVDDEAELIAWLEGHHPDLVKVETVKKVPRTELRKAFGGIQEMSADETEGADPTKKHMWLVDASTGEPVPGIHLEQPAADRFSYEVTDTPPA